jgi:chorismate-pyruvate lyase
MTTVPTESVRGQHHELAPLNDFYRRAGRTMPRIRFCAGGELPEPARTLLHHERDMTRTLERFHGKAIHLRLLSSWRMAADYGRECVLELEGTNQPVEFGAIHIALDSFPETAREQILAEHLPLGGILNQSGITYTSRPTAFFSLEPDAFITCALHLERTGVLYGRQNTLRHTNGIVLAQIVEILPPEAAVPSQ